MTRTPSSIVTVILCFIVAACSTQSPPTSQSMSLVGPSGLRSSVEGVGGATAAALVAPAQVCGGVDTEPPVISGVGASPSTLWPPNHKWNAVTVSYTTTDCSPPVTCFLTVASDEPVNGLGDGNTAPDWEVTGPHSVRLRAERAGPQDGRVYTITIHCRDAANNTSTATTTVTVAHDQRKT